MEDNNAISSLKLNENEWGFIEKPLTIDEYKRNQELYNYGISLSNQQFNKTVEYKTLTTIGIYYFIIRDLVKPYIKLDVVDNPLDCNKKNKLTNTEKALLNSVKKIVTDKTNSLIRYFNLNNYVENYETIIANIDYIELRLVLLMKLIEHYIILPYNADTQEEIDELIISSNKIKKLINIVDFKKINSNTNNELSRQLLIDFNEKVDLLKKFNVTIYEIANRNPKLIHFAKYDNIISLEHIKPYESQKQVMETLIDNFNNGVLIYYKTVQGGGKTSLILTIMAYLRQINSNIKLIFCCAKQLEAIKLYIGRIIYNFEGKIGIGTATTDISDDGKKSYYYKITNSYKCEKFKNDPLHGDRYKNKDFKLRYNINKIKCCEILICDYLTTYLLLQENSELLVDEDKSEYLLFFDEPTFECDKLIKKTLGKKVLIDNDVKNNLINNELSNEYLIANTTKFMSKILYYAPKHTILSSATLPNKNTYAELVEHLKTKYNDLVDKEIISNKIIIGCMLKDFDNNLIIPHINCNNFNDLENFINKIKENPLVGKFYTLVYLINLNEFLKQYNLNIDLGQIETFNHDVILENILILFNIIVTNNNIVDYNAFKNINIYPSNECNKYNSNIDPTFNKIDFSKILTRHAYKYVGGTLIATAEPLEFVKTHFYPIVNIIKKKLNIENIGDEYEQYLQRKKLNELEIDRLELNAKKNKEGVDNNDLEIFSNNNLKFNKMFEINTEQHFNAFSTYVKKCDNSMLKNNIDQKDININQFYIDDNLKLLLYIGVGIYSKNLPKNYTDKILLMLEDKQLAFFIADESFAFGANYSLSNIIVLDDLGAYVSINTLMQLIGRAGRVGRSWSSTIYLDTITKTKIINFLSGELINNDEDLIIHYSLLDVLNNENYTYKYDENNLTKTTSLQNTDLNLGKPIFKQISMSLLDDKLWNKNNNISLEDITINEQKINQEIVETRKNDISNILNNKNNIKNNEINKNDVSNILNDKYNITNETRKNNISNILNNKQPTNLVRLSTINSFDTPKTNVNNESYMENLMKKYKK